MKASNSRSVTKRASPASITLVDSVDQGKPQRTHTGLSRPPGACPADLERVLEAAAVPHWFDERVLGALLDEDLRAEAHGWLETLIALPAITSSSDGCSFSVRAAERSALRLQLIARDPDRFRLLAARAASAFSRPDVIEEIERAYHLLLADPKVNPPAVYQLALRLAGNANQSLALATRIHEYAEDGGWPALARGWGFLLDAWARRHLQPVRDTFEAADRALQSFGEANDHRGIGFSHGALGAAALLMGNSRKAREHYDAAEHIHRRLIDAQPQSHDRERDLSLSREGVGDVLLAQDDRAGALRIYRRSLAARGRLVAVEPGNWIYQRDLLVTACRLGDCLRVLGKLAPAQAAYMRASAVAQLLMKADPSDVRAQRDLAATLTDIAVVHCERGDPAEAPRIYADCLSCFKRLAEDEPHNGRWRRDSAVTLGRMGDALLAQGDLAGAHTSYRDALDIFTSLAANDPSNAVRQHDLALTHTKLAEVLNRQGDLVGALAGYRLSLAIAQKLVRTDPDNRRWQRSLTTWNSDIGDLLRDHGDPVGALGAYQEAFANQQRLVAVDPTNALWQRDLAFLHEAVALAYESQGNRPEALPHAEASQAIMARLQKLPRIKKVKRSDLERVRALVGRLRVG